jgi:hypothetical protein
MKDEKRMQMRITYKTEQMHMQGVDPATEMGRPYGTATELRANEVITGWLATQKATLVSAASGDLLYIPFTVAEYQYEGNEFYQMLIEGTPMNHPDGMCLDMSVESPHVRHVLSFAKASGLLQAGVGEPYDSNDFGYDVKGGEEE